MVELYFGAAIGRKENCFKKYVKIMLISCTNLRPMLLCLMDILFRQKTQLAKNVQEGFQIQLKLRTYIRVQQIEMHSFQITQTRKPLFKFLGSKLELLGFNVIQCLSDADTTIVKIALNSNDDKPVTIYLDDTDFFVCVSIIACNYLIRETSI